MKVAVVDGKVELYSERQFNYALEAIWGRTLAEQNGELDNYFKFDHLVAAWIDAAGLGWITVPDFVTDGQLLAL